MTRHENDPNPLLGFLYASESALGTKDLQKLYVKKYKETGSAFYRYLHRLEEADCMVKVGTATELLDIKRLGTSVDPNKRLFYLWKGQLGVWFERNNTRNRTSPMPNATPIESRLKIYSACDKGLEAGEAAEKAGVSKQVAAEQYRKWNAIPTEVFDGAFGTDGGVTFTEVKRVVERRLDDSVPDPLLREKLDYMVLLGYCETVKMDEKTCYSAKEPLPRPKRR